MKHEVLQALLIDVRDQGSARVDRRKLAWMLGRINLNASAFTLLLEEWQQVANDAPLYGTFWGDEYTFTAAIPVNVNTWTA